MKDLIVIGILLISIIGCNENPSSFDSTGSKIDRSVIDKTVRCQVFDSSGNLDAGAKIYVCSGNGERFLWDGTTIRILKKKQTNPELLTLTANEKGEFSFEPTASNWVIFVAGKNGYSITSSSQSGKHTVLREQQWSQISGTYPRVPLPVDSVAVAQDVFSLRDPKDRNAVRVSLCVYGPKSGPGPVLEFSATVKADAERKFEFHQVIAGDAIISRQTSADVLMGVEQYCFPIKSGTSQNITLENAGQQVKVKLPEKAIVNWEGAYGTLTAIPKQPQSPLVNPHYYLYSRRSYLCQLTSNGELWAGNVKPGEYELKIQIWRRDKGSLNQISVADYSGVLTVDREPIVLSTINYRILDKLVFSRKEFQLIDGSNFVISDSQSQITLVVFWATWCGPCRNEILVLKELYSKYHARGLRIISVSIDDEVSKVEEFVKANKIPWDQCVLKPTDANSLLNELGVNGIPATFLVKPDGKAMIFNPMNGKDNMLDKMMKQKQ